MEKNIKQFICYCESVVKKEMDIEDKQFILNNAKTINIAKGGFYIKAGDMPKYMAFNLKGILRAFVIDVGGAESTKYFFAENSFVSAYSSLRRNCESKIFIQAIENCTMLIFDYAAIKYKIETSMFFLKLINIYLEEMLLYKEEREEILMRSNSVDKYIDFISNRKNLEKRIKNEYIATYIGITPESLSRIRKKLKKENEN